MSLNSSRSLFFLAFLGCIVVMGGALFLEYYLGQIPCPLCLIQRGFVILFAVVCLLAALHGPGVIGRRIYSVFALLFASLGAATAGRQLWLQTLPPESLPSCLPDLDYMLDVFPLQEVLGMMLHGSADCAKVEWTLFGLSIPDWSLLTFIAMILFSLLQLLRKS